MEESFWTGSISLREGDPAGDAEIQLFNEYEGCQIPATSKLSFLSFVDCSRIPLYIICGPSYEVVVSSRCWIQDGILGSFPENDIRKESHIESGIGALLRVDRDGANKKDDDTPDVTELLMYARIECDSDTTPRFSDALGNNQAQVSKLWARLYALPLSSTLLYDANRYSSPPTPPPEEQCSNISGTFLQQIDINKSRKRRRLNNLFDEAAKPRSRPKRQDSHDLAHLIPSRPNSPLPGYEGCIKLQQRPLSSTHSRAHSMSSLHEERILDRGHTLVRARSSLSRVASTSVLSRPSSRGTDIRILDDKIPVTESKNKRILSTMVMASMRMRGMSQRRTGSKLVEDPVYKLMYHNTFKAANFALRDRMEEELAADSMGDVIDVLLDLFCGDGESASFDVSHQETCLNEEVC